MNANAKLWVEALRSGEYEQTFGALADHIGYCCMGVACEVYIKAGGDLQHHIENGYGVYGLEDRFLPLVVRTWLGLSDDGGGYDGGESLVDRNDNGRTFAEIADIIESEPEYLFAEA